MAVVLLPFIRMANPSMMIIIVVLLYAKTLIATTVNLLACPYGEYHNLT
jgi:hypothetical protein